MVLDLFGTTVHSRESDNTDHPVRALPCRWVSFLGCVTFDVPWQDGDLVAAAGLGQVRSFPTHLGTDMLPPYAFRLTADCADSKPARSSHRPGGKPAWVCQQL